MGGDSPGSPGSVRQRWPGARFSLPATEVSVLSLLWRGDSGAHLRGCSCGLDGAWDVHHLPDVGRVVRAREVVSGSAFSLNTF